jgi:hypothetical protein
MTSQLLGGQGGAAIGTAMLALLNQASIWPEMQSPAGTLCRAASGAAQAARTGAFARGAASAGVADSSAVGELLPRLCAASCSSELWAKRAAAALTDLCKADAASAALCLQTDQGALAVGQLRDWCGSQSSGGDRAKLALAAVEAAVARSATAQ